MTKLLLFILFAGIALCTPIQVTGSGSFALSNDVGDSNTMACFSGSDGVHSVSACAGNFPTGNTPPTYLSISSFFAPDVTGGATIDGIRSSYFQLSLGGYGAGYLKLMDGQNVIATQEITGMLETTSYREIGTKFTPGGVFNLNWYAFGTFDIVPSNVADETPNADTSSVPEASTGLLAGAGLLALLAKKDTTRFRGPHK